jgi:hypothetical protein
MTLGCEKGLLAWEDELGGQSAPMYCVPLELGRILDHENQRYIAED